MKLTGSVHLGKFLPFTFILRKFPQPGAFTPKVWLLYWRWESHCLPKMSTVASVKIIKDMYID